jgi:hypothetical protein
MKFLEQIAELDERTRALQQARDALSGTIDEARKQGEVLASLVDQIQQAIAGAPVPRLAQVKLPNGAEVSIILTDGLLMAAALCVALDGGEPEIALESGQTFNLKLTDYEQVAPQVLKAAAAAKGSP